MVGLDRWRQALRACDVPPHLNERVMDRIGALRAEEERASGEASLADQGAHARPAERGSVVQGNAWVLNGGGAIAGGSAAGMSRRGFIVAGAAACLGVGALSIGLLSRGRDLSDAPASRAAGSGTGTGEQPAVPAGVPAAGRPAFGLAVMEGAEPGVPMALEARPSGCVLVQDIVGLGGRFLLNLACMGEGIVRVAYDFLENPPVGYSWAEGFDTKVAHFSTCVEHLLTPQMTPQTQQAIGTWLDGTTDRPVFESETMVVDYRTHPAWDGSMTIEGVGEAYEVINVTVGEEGYWGIDPVLQARKRLLDAHFDGDLEAVARCEAELAASFAEVSSSEESLVAWLKSCHGKALRLAVDTLAIPTLELEATFSDGTTARRSYRFGAVEDFAEVADGRFDALFERYGLGADAYNYSAAPFYNFDSYFPAEDEADPRLTRPLVTLTDVTGAVS